MVPFSAALCLDFNYGKPGETPYHLIPLPMNGILVYVVM